MEMELMGFNNWDILLTLIIAVYGAMLSTYYYLGCKARKQT